MKRNRQRFPPMSSNILSIVVGTLDRRDQIQRLVESVEREMRIPYVLYVTDAGSTDGTIEYLKSVASERVRPVFVGRKLGQARAYNDVFMQVDTPYVCWVSDDNEIVNDGLGTAVSILQRNKRIGMVGLKVKDMEGPFIDATYIGGISTIGILNVNQGVLPTPLMNAIGGFSEEFRDYGIDPDLTAKVLYNGYDIVYTRDIAIHHYRNWSMDEASEEFKALRKKHVRSLELYEETYGELAKNTASLNFKRNVWGQIKKVANNRFDLSLNSTQKIFGSVPRDYYNALHSRYISAFDPFLTIGKPYHLRQRGQKSGVALG